MLFRLHAVGDISTAAALARRLIARRVYYGQHYRYRHFSPLHD